MINRSGYDVSPEETSGRSRRVRTRSAPRRRGRKRGREEPRDRDPTRSVPRLAPFPRPRKRGIRSRVESPADGGVHQRGSRRPRRRRRRRDPPARIIPLRRRRGYGSRPDEGFRRERRAKHRAKRPPFSRQRCRRAARVATTSSPRPRTAARLFPPIDRTRRRRSGRRTRRRPSRVASPPRASVPRRSVRAPLFARGNATRRDRPRRLERARRRNRRRRRRGRGSPQKSPNTDARGWRNVGVRRRRRDGEASPQIRRERPRNQTREEFSAHAPAPRTAEVIRVGPKLPASTTISVLVSSSTVCLRRRRRSCSRRADEPRATSPRAATWRHCRPRRMPARRRRRHRIDRADRDASERARTTSRIDGRFRGG